MTRKGNNNNNNNTVVDFLKLLTTTNTDQRKALLRYISRSQCTIVRHLAYNLMFNQNIEITSKDRGYLRRHTEDIKRLASKKTCIGKRKAILLRKHLLVKRLAQLALRYLQ